MKRKIEKDLLEWKKKSNGRTVLLLEGARRIGKSYSVKMFAESMYRSYILVDFNEVGEEIRKLFEMNLRDLDSFFMYLSAAYNTKLYNRDSLIIFDEVQMFPRARAALKFLVADGRYDYIETGSLLSIKKNVKDIVIPSEERHLKMYPMDFEEFLWARGEDMVMPMIRDSFEKRKPLGQIMHRRIMTLFREYVIIGGMPQAVEEYIRTRDFEAVDMIKRDILALYRADIRKHAAGHARKVLSIFEKLPSQLSKSDKKFRLRSLGVGTRFRDYESAFMWLQDSMIADICFNSTEPNLGLKLNRDNSSFKLYMADTGLLISHAFDENGIASEEVYKKLLLGKLEVNEGMIFENIVAQMLTASGRKQYFYSNSSREDRSRRMEIDFLIAKSRTTNRHNISPLEVKSGKNYTLSSINKFRLKYPEELNEAFVLHTEDLAINDGITYLPVYMTCCL